MGAIESAESTDDDEGGSEVWVAKAETSISSRWSVGGRPGTTDG